MIRWQPIKNIKIKETEAEARTKIKFMERFVGCLYVFIAVLLLSSKYYKFPEIVSLFLGILFISSTLFFFLKYRKYYISLMEKSKIRSVWHYEDYSWKNSLTIILLLVAFAVLFVVALLKLSPLLEKLM